MGVVWEDDFKAGTANSALFVVSFFPSFMSDSLENFITGTNYQPLDVIGEGAYGIVWQVLLCDPQSRQSLILHTVRPYTSQPNARLQSSV